MTKVVLVCDGEKLNVDLDVVNKSTILKNMIEDTGKEGDIPIPNIQLPILKKIIEFCEHYKNSNPKEIKKPLVSSKLTENNVDDWDANFIEFEKVDDLIDLVIAANFLDIECLVALGCAKIATLIKGKSVEEIRDTFGIQNDFTPQEEKQLREENQWAEEAI